MALFSKFKFLFASKFILMGVNLINKYQILVISKSQENYKSWTIAFESYFKMSVRQQCWMSWYQACEKWLFIYEVKSFGLAP